MVETPQQSSRNGARDFVMQRVSAVVLAAYAFFLTGYFLLHHPVTFMAWHGLFSKIWMRIFSTAALGSLTLHAWIGIWTVLTDYVHHLLLRRYLERFFYILLLTSFIWGLTIIWS